MASKTKTPVYKSHPTACCIKIVPAYMSTCKIDKYLIFLTVDLLIVF